MPVSVTSDIDTPQDYIPFFANGLQHKLGNAALVFDDLTEFKARAQVQKNNLASGLGVWKHKTPLFVMSEPFHRLWFRATGGTDAQNSAASHGRTVALGSGRTYVFDNDDSTVLTTDGIPASGVGANKDIAIDPNTGLIYRKASGTWAYFRSLNFTAPAPVLSQAMNRSAISFLGIGTGATNFAAGTQAQRSYTRTFQTSGSRFKLRLVNALASNTGEANGPFQFVARGSVSIGGGAPVPWTFGGARDATVAPGAVMETDWINAPFVKGQVCRHQDLFTAASAISSWPGSTLRSFDSGDRLEIGSGLTDRTLTNWTDGAAPYRLGYTIMPWLDSLTEAPPGNVSILLVGDSLTSNGAEDGPEDQPTKEYRGYAMQALGANYAWHSSGTSGLKMNEAIGYAGASVNQYNARLGRYANRGFTHCMLFLGINDQASLTGGTAFMAQVADAKAKVEALGMRLILATITPNTNAGNTAERTAGQAASYEAIRQLIIASGIPYFDAWLYCRNPSNTALWRTDLGTPTADGIHPNAAIHAALATALSAQLPALLAL